MGTERRQYPRVEAQIPVRYRKQGDADAPLCLGLLTCDVSAGGLMFRTKEFLAAAWKWELELDLPSAARPIKATSQVVWIKDGNAEGDYHVGSRFLEITRKDRELISQYVDGLQ